MQNNPDIILLDTYAIVIYSQVNPRSFRGHTVAALLGGSFNFNGFNRNDIVVGNSDYSETPTVEIRTPGSLFNKLDNISNPTRVVYNVFLNDALFSRRNSYLNTNNDGSTGNLSSVIVAARVAGDVEVTNLDDQVWMSFLKNKTDNSQKTLCTFWDQQKDNGYGAWSTEGCSVTRESTDDATCQCSHLTAFTLIENGTITDPTIGPYTVVGIIVLFVCTVLVLLSYIVSRYVCLLFSNVAIMCSIIQILFRISFQFSDFDFSLLGSP